MDELESVSDPGVQIEVDQKEEMNWVKVDFSHLRPLFPCELCKDSSKHGIVVTSCHHVFHPQCLSKFVGKNKKCPACPKVHKNFYSICEDCK